MLARRIKRILDYVVANPWVYDAVQNLLGHKKTCRILAPRFADATEASVLDVGAGTGNLAHLLPPAIYFWLDNDLDKLRGFISKFRGKYHAVLCDAAHLSIRSHSMDYVACIAMAHHLDEDAFSVLLAELARVCRGRLVFLDPTWYPTSRTGRLLWWLDRGAYPRTPEKLLSSIGQHFEIIETVRYSIWHHYLLCVAKPRLPVGLSVPPRATT